MFIWLFPTINSICMLVDQFNRVHDYLRISLTDRCDLRCFYCMPEEHYSFTPSPQLMQAEEVAALAKIFVLEGVRKIRLTGGEPLVRKDFTSILESLGRLDVQLTLTTNGTRLGAIAEQVRSAGIRSLNISLDTLDRNRFQVITRRDLHTQVMESIDRMLELGIGVKVNVVVMRGINEQEVVDFIRWTKDTPIHVRFIEFMPFDGNRWNQEKVVSLKEILARAREEFDLVPLEREKHETAKKFIVPGHQGTFAVISTMTAPFCGDCNRIRLTADGKLKNCLFSTTETDLLTAFRQGLDIRPLIYENIRAKKAALGGQFTADLDRVEVEQLENRSMIRIGG